MDSEFANSYKFKFAFFEFGLNLTNHPLLGTTMWPGLFNWASFIRLLAPQLRPLADYCSCSFSNLFSLFLLCPFVCHWSACWSRQTQHGLGVCIWMHLVNGTGNSPSPGQLSLE